MNARTTNLAILFLLAVELCSGLASFLVGRPDWQWVFWLHAAGGFSLVVLIGWKYRIVARSFARRGAGIWASGSVVLAVIFLLAVGTGVWWSLAGRGSVDIPLYGEVRILVIHSALGIVISVPLLVHAAGHWSKPRKSDFTTRRNAIRLGLVAVAGVVLSQTSAATRPLTTAATRFTGSREERSFEGNAFPTTQWLGDDRQRIDRGAWRLRVRGGARGPLRFSYDDLAALPQTEQIETIDCTGGWFSVQRWRGVAVAAFLDQAGAPADAESIVVRSVTGFDRRFPISEAGRLLIATHVGGEPLSAGHGAPARLVAPGRRGYHWVKWVESIELSTRPAWWQPPLPLQ